MKTPAVRIYWLTWLALLVLLALTCASAYVPMGRLNLVTNIGIAIVKALAVAFVFMRVRKDGPAAWLAALAGLAWLAILAGLSLPDFMARMG